MSICIFCEIIAGEAPAEILWENRLVMQIVPLNPVVEGHTLVIPKTHVEDALTYPMVTGGTMKYASMLAPRPCNFITSVGVEATQSVFHLHIHIIPRKVDDGLALPWYSGKGNH